MCEWVCVCVYGTQKGWDRVRCVHGICQNIVPPMRLHAYCTRFTNRHFSFSTAHTHSCCATVDLPLLLPLLPLTIKCQLLLHQTYNVKWSNPRFIHGDCFSSASHHFQIKKDGNRASPSNNDIKLNKRASVLYVQQEMTTIIKITGIATPPPPRFPFPYSIHIFVIESTLYTVFHSFILFIA